MSKPRHHNLPSISTLLTTPPPPRIVVVDENQNNGENSNSTLLSSRYSLKSPGEQYHGNDRLSATLSPMLSPIDSYASSVNSLSPNINSSQPTSPLPSPSTLSLPPNHFLPPLQGDDPPRKLTRQPSISSLTSDTSKPTYNSLWSSISTPSSPNPHNQQTSNYSSSRSYCSPSPPPPSSPMAMSVDLCPSRSPSPAAPIAETRPPLPPSTQIVLSESGQPILKRRRGRPPSMREPALDGGWTFLTPTVWDVKHNQSNQSNNSSTSTAAAEANATADSIMNGSMAAFTSSNMDMVLQMPRKKRGRKPKTHVAGNSCFVWKDITAPRRSTKVIKEQAALRRLEQASSSES